MDLLDNVATELGFEFHLYVVRDQLFGSKEQRDVKDFLKSNKKLSQPKFTGETTSNQGSSRKFQSTDESESESEREYSSQI